MKTLIFKQNYLLLLKSSFQFICHQKSKVVTKLEMSALCSCYIKSTDIAQLLLNFLITRVLLGVL